MNMGITMSNVDMQNEVLAAAHTMAYLLPLQRNDEELHCVQVDGTSDQCAVVVGTDRIKFDRRGSFSRKYENKLNGSLKQKHTLCSGQRRKIGSELQSCLIKPCTPKEKIVTSKIEFPAEMFPSRKAPYNASNEDLCLNSQCYRELSNPNHIINSNLSEYKHDHGNEYQSAMKPEYSITIPHTREKAILNYRNLTNTNKSIVFVKQGSPNSNKTYIGQCTSINVLPNNNTPNYLKQVQMDTIQEWRCISQNCCKIESISQGGGCKYKVIDERTIHSLLKSSTKNINRSGERLGTQCISSSNSFNDKVRSQYEDIGSRNHSCRLDNGKCKSGPTIVTLSTEKGGNDRVATNISNDGDCEQRNEGNFSNSLLTEPIKNQTKYRARNEESRKYLIAKTRTGHKKRGGARSPKSNVRRRRIEGSNSVSEIMSWASGTIYNGRIYHPEVGYLVHPSYFSSNHEPKVLCSYGKKCSHKPACRDIRALMAARSYMENRNNLSYRDIEAVWGVSRSTVQRKTTFLKSISQSTFDKLYQEIGWKNEKTTQKSNPSKQKDQIIFNNTSTKITMSGSGFEAKHKRSNTNYEI